MRKQLEAMPKNPRALDAAVVSAHNAEGRNTKIPIRHEWG